jgi:YbgC/YbaW family acyl-CoA thioester hydrolase
LQLLFYPGTAPRQDRPSHRRYDHGLVLEQVHIEYFFGHYIDLGGRDDWRFAPLNAPDVDGVAPAWIGLAECDPLFDEGIEWGGYTARGRGARRAGGLARRHPRVHQDGAGPARGAAGPCRRRRGPRPSLPSTMTRDDFRFFHHLRVRWAEVDMQKIVFNAHYLMYFDTAVADYWRALALPYEEAMHQLGGDLYVKKATVEFHASARMDDQLDIGMRCSRVGTSSMLFQGASSAPSSS